jgi:hypothetical protein
MEERLIPVVAARSKLDIVSAFGRQQVVPARGDRRKHPWLKKSHCPGAGACGGYVHSKHDG